MIFTMAKVSNLSFLVLKKVNCLFEMGRLKEQRVNSGESMHSTVSLRQWHLKPLYVT